MQNKQLEKVFNRHKLDIVPIFTKHLYLFLAKRKDSGPENRIIEDLAAADRNVATTPEGTAYLRHRRLSELAEPGRRSSKGMSISSPATPPPAGDLNISDLVKEVSTPHRDLLYNVLKEMQSKETPESQRIRKLVATPGAQTKTPPTPKIPGKTFLLKLTWNFSHNLQFSFNMQTSFKHQKFGKDVLLSWIHTTYHRPEVENRVP